MLPRVTADSAAIDECLLALSPRGDAFADLWRDGVLRRSRFVPRRKKLQLDPKLLAYRDSGPCIGAEGIELFPAAPFGLVDSLTTSEPYCGRPMNAFQHRV